MALEPRLLDLVFGDASSGDTPELRAATSSVRFVRSQDHLAMWRAGATGRILSAIDALDAYGFEKLVECIDFGSAILPPTLEEPSRTLLERRKALCLTQEHVARAASVPVTAVKLAETQSARSPIVVLESIAAVLGLDDRLIGSQIGAGGDQRLAVRLKTLSQRRLLISAGMVTTLAEGAWVIRTQIRLLRQLGLYHESSVSPDSNYGSPNYPAWRHGYYLAQKARESLGLGQDPIESLRGLCARLQVPVVFAGLADRFAGATIDSGEGRGILVNFRGQNSNVWVRRATIAHELGHLLWDPADRLESVRVDDYAELDLRNTSRDPVEARANAFAIAFLAPPGATEQVFRSQMDECDGLKTVMDRFGISFTAARFHIRNILDQHGDNWSIRTSPVSPSDEWRGREDYTMDWFPIAKTPDIRKGEFAGVVVAAQRKGIISLDKAAAYLRSNPTEFEEAADHIAELFPMPTL